MEILTDSNMVKSEYNQSRKKTKKQKRVKYFFIAWAAFSEMIVQIQKQLRSSDFYENHPLPFLIVHASLALFA